jgi:hypothetical protein
MNSQPTEPVTTGFGAVPRPEEPPRFEPRPYVAPPSQPWFSHGGAHANATVVNNIRVAGGSRRTRCNHLTHFLLTVSTCGLWAPVWFFAWVTARQR